MNTQASFASALFDSEQPCPADLYCGNGADPASRFAVYRNNVQSSLINALADAYPVVAQLVGDEFFRAMATLYVRRFPPTSAVLSDYGHDFADFIGGFLPPPACLTWPMSRAWSACGSPPTTPPTPARCHWRSSQRPWPSRKRWGNCAWNCIPRSAY